MKRTADSSAMAKRTVAAGGRRKVSKRTLNRCQRVAIGTGATACTGLALSVYHCTEAICTLTNSPPLLACALAICIDVGMATSELACIVAKGTAERAYRWANLYAWTAVGLSSVLNAIGTGVHGTSVNLVACAVGACIPALVFMLCKCTGYLWTGE